MAWRGETYMCGQLPDSSKCLAQACTLVCIILFVQHCTTTSPISLCRFFCIAVIFVWRHFSMQSYLYEGIFQCSHTYMKAFSITVILVWRHFPLQSYLYEGFLHCSHTSMKRIFFYCRHTSVKAFSLQSYLYENFYCSYTNMEAFAIAFILAFIFIWKLYFIAVMSSSLHSGQVQNGNFSITILFVWRLLLS